MHTRYLSTLFVICCLLITSFQTFAQSCQYSEGYFIVTVNDVNVDSCYNTAIIIADVNGNFITVIDPVTEIGNNAFVEFNGVPIGTYNFYAVNYLIEDFNNNGVPLNDIIINSYQFIDSILGTSFCFAVDSFTANVCPAIKSVCENSGDSLRVVQSPPGSYASDSLHQQVYAAFDLSGNLIQVSDNGLFSSGSNHPNLNSTSSPYNAFAINYLLSDFPSGISALTLQQIQNSTDSITISADSSRLFITPAIRTVQNVSICMGDSFLVANSIYKQPGYYKDTFTASNGCDSILTTNISFYPLLGLDLGADTAICRGESLTLTAPEGHTYQWITGETTDTIYVVPPFNNSYSVTITSSNNCIESDTISVTVLTTPTINNSQDSFVCPGDSITLTTSGTGSFIWSNGSTDSAITVSPDISTTYFVTYTLANGCTKTEGIFIQAVPFFSVTTVPESATCFGGLNGSAKAFPAPFNSIPSGANFVTSSADSGPNSLRDLIQNATSGDVIIILTPDEIILTGGPIIIDKDITIIGNYPVTSFISGSTTRVFEVYNVATATLQFITIQNGDDIDGGGVLNEGNLTIRECLIQNCHGLDNGGGISNFGTLNLLNSALVGNNIGGTGFLGFFGAGIYNLGTLYIDNSTISFNTNGSLGGGIYNEGHTTLLNSTVTGNFAFDGGGVYNKDSVFIIGNSIIAQNFGFDGTDGNCFPHIPISLGYNIIGDNVEFEMPDTGTNQIDVNPMLDVLAYNGGITPTHALLPGSPAIDAGTCSLNGLTQDQRALTRPFDVTTSPNVNDGCDIGAYEFGAAFPVYTYLWSDGQTTDKALNLAADNYFVTVTDENGCFVVDTTSVSSPDSIQIAIDLTKPSCPGNCDGQATPIVSGGNGGYSYLWNDIDFQTTSTAYFLCERDYTVYVTDSLGCTDSLNFTVVAVPDSIPPVLMCPPNQQYECVTQIPSPEINFTSNFSGFDDCELDESSLMFVSDSSNGLSCNEIVYRIYNISDVSGHTGNCIQEFLLVDVTVPNIICPPDPDPVDCPNPFNRSDVHVNFPQDSSIAPSITGYPVANDNCGIDTVYFNDTLIGPTFDCQAIFQVKRTWFVKDFCGSTDTCIQTIPFLDSIPPLISGDFRSDTFSCSGAVYFEEPVITDACDTAIFIIVSTDSIPGPCPNAYSLTRTWNAIDFCDNASSTSQTIYVIDNSNPLLIIPKDTSVFCFSDTSTSITGTASATDNCGGPSTISYTDIVDTNNLGFITVINRVWTAQDYCGNSSTDIQQISFFGCCSPAALSANVTHINCPGSAEGSIDLVLTGGVGPFSFQWSNGQTSEDIANLSTGTYAVTVTALGGCTSFISIVVEESTDTIAPVINCPSNISIDCSQSTDPTITGKVTVSDNCDPMPIVSNIDSVITGLCSNEMTIIRTFSAFDLSGNISSCFQQIIVTDTIKPIFVNLPGSLNRTVSCSNPAEISSALNLQAFATDNCGSVFVSEFSIDTIPSLCQGEFFIERNFIASDDCGNTSNLFKQTISVVDTTGPIFTSFTGSLDTTIICDDFDGLLFALSLSPFASDNCGSASIVGPTKSASFGLCADSLSSRTITQTWFAVDDCGNVSKAFVQTISVIDTVKPGFAEPFGSLDSSLTCNDAIGLQQALALEPTPFDNCASNMMLDGPPAMNSVTGVCPQQQTITRSWTTTDACGNISDPFIQIIQIDDNVGPVFSQIPGQLNRTVNCGDLAALQTALSLTPTILDDCDSFPYLDPDPLVLNIPGGCPGMGTITRTFTATDDCGNNSTYTQIIEIADTQAPVFIDVIGSLDTTVLCNDFGGLLHALNLVPVAYDQCGSATLSGPVKSATFGSCGDSISSRIISQTWFAIDNCGNTSAAFVQTITVVDTIKPEFAEAPGTLNRNLSCDDHVGLQQALNLEPTTLDNCAVNLSLDGPPSVSEVTGSCPQEKSITRIWTTTDGCGNVSEPYVQTIHIMDTTGPIFSELPGQLDRNLYCGDTLSINAALSLFPSVADDCDTLAYVDTDPFVNIIAGSCAGTSIITRIFTAEDACGNLSTYQQTIEITDTLAPYFTTPAGGLDTLLSCNDGAGIFYSLMLAPEVADLCDSNVTIIGPTKSVIFGSCTDSVSSRTITQTWTAVDDCGNISQLFTQVITVVDTSRLTFLQKPNILDRSFSCDNTSGVAQALTLEPTPYDNCSAIIGLNGPPAVDTIPSACPQSFDIVRSWTAADACGNVSDPYVQTISILDTVGPVFTNSPGSLDVTMNCNDGFALVFALSLQPSAIDNCQPNVPIGSPVKIITDSLITRTWTVMDECGNSSQPFVQSIFITDNLAPFALCHNYSTSLDSNGIFILLPEHLDNGSFDNCSDTLNFSLSQSVFNCSDAGANIVTMTVSDGFGLSSSCQSVVTINNGLDLIVTGMDNLCPGSNTGSVTAVASNGTGNYTYLWSTGHTTMSANFLSEGIYSVTVSDASGCSSTNSVTLSPIAQPPVIVISNDTFICTGQNLELTVSGGSSYSWSNGFTTTTFSVSPANTTTYFVTVTNALGCESTDSVVVSIIDCASVGDFVWFDTNGNGVFDSGEIPFPSLSVYLYDNFGIIIDSTITDISGNYIFENVPTGNYYVGFEIPDGYSSTIFNSGGSQITNSNGSGTTNTFFVGFSDVLTIDAGLIGTGFAGDLVFHDFNSNTIFDSGDTGISGVTIILEWYGVDGIQGNSDDITYTAVTDASGHYLFTMLAPGNYNISVLDGSGTTLSDYNSTTANNPTAFSLNSLLSMIDLTFDFGYQQNCIPPVLEISVINATCSDLNNGSASVSIISGTPPHSFIWSNGTTVQNLSNVLPGTYSVTVTFQVGCSTVASVSIGSTDTIPPFVNCPDDTLVFTENNSCSTPFSYMVSAVDDCSDVSIDQLSGSSSGALFPLGITSNQFSISDSSGNSVNCTFSVIVNDIVPPIFVCPSDTVIIVNGNNCSAFYSYSVSVSDNCSGIFVNQTAGLITNSTFTEGETVNNFIAIDGSGNIDSCRFSVTVNCIQDLCLAPDTTFATPTSYTSMLLNWDTVTNAVGYQIRGRIVGSNGFVYLNISGNVGWRIVKGLEPGTSYEWEIRTFCSNDTSGWTGLSVFTTPQCLPPLPIFVTNVTSTHAQLNWTQVTGSKGYQILGRKQGTTAVSTLDINKETTTSKSISNLKPSTKYEWQVRTRCKGGDYPVYSAFTPVNVFTTFMQGQNSRYESVKDPANKFNMVVYPNPNEGNFTLLIEGLEKNNEVLVEIFNMIGSKVYIEYVPVLDDSVSKVDIQLNEVGSYIIKVSEEGQYHYKKVFINR